MTVTSPELAGRGVRSALRTCPQLRALHPEALEVLARAAVIRRYASGEALFRAGDAGDAMFVLLRGSVVSRITSPAGDVVDLGVASVGHAFGYFELVDPGPRTEDAVATRDSVVLALPAAAALRALRVSPDTLLALAGDLVRIVRQSNRARAGRSFHPVPRRLATLLLELDHHGDRVDFGGPQTLLAQRLGIARQTLNTALRGLAERGLIAVHPGGRGATLDRPALTAYALR
ncbi:Crp/Fnr family transcriptional regulator [Actinomycetospora flava]|uniref:Crp/Fnr family transcriptional regulator n=1 Tax=Actinomycetospora flava TaxID=3129232 RepID=A0ABU8M2Q3_9PSEU